MKKEVKIFTLVELLVAVSVIALLIALLLPALSLAHQKARDTVCKNNLRQIGVAIQLYRSDYDERYPDYGAIGARDESGNEYPLANYRRGLGENDGNGVEKYGMAAALKPYLGYKNDIWNCPSATPLKLSYKNTYAWNAKYFNSLSLTKGMSYTGKTMSFAKLNKKPILYDNIENTPIPTGQFANVYDLPAPAVTEQIGPHRQSDPYASLYSGTYGGVYALSAGGYISTWNTLLTE